MNENRAVVGLPAKKRKFDFLTESGVSGDCFLQGALLYVLRFQYLNENQSSSDIRVIDLNSYDGDESSYEIIFQKNGFDGCAIANSGSNLIAIGSRRIAVDKNTGSVVVSEFENYAPTGWKRASGAFFFDNLYIRQLDNDHIKNGMDLFDVNLKKVVGHLDADMISPAYIGDDLIAGNNKGGFGLFSINENKYVFELDCKECFDCEAEALLDYHHSRCGDRLVIARNNSVVVVDLTNLILIKHIKCTESEQIQMAIKEYSSKEKHMTIQGVGMSGGKIIINGGQRVGYVMCIDLDVKDDPIRWVYIGSKIDSSNYVGGELVFGIEKSRPVAWDIYTGDKVWGASASTIANKIQIGDGWVVYSQLSGYIQCFNWKKPYISPHRPEA